MQNKLFSLHVLPLCFLLAISVLSHIVWLNPFAVLTNGDVWFLYKDAMLISNWGTWASLLSLGGVNVSYNLFLLTTFWQLAARVGLNYQIANQIIYFFPIIFITPIAAYAYLYLLTKSRIAAFIGSLFYMFPTFFLMSQNGGLLYAFVHVILPLIFLFFERYFRFNKTKDGIILILLLSLSIVYELRITYITILVLLAYTIFLFVLRFKKKFLFELIPFIWKAKYILILFLAINAYIYLPTILTPVKETAVAVTGRALFGASFFTIKEPLVLMHPFWSGTVPTEFIPQPIPFYFWLFPFYAFLSLYFVKNNKRIVFFALTAIIAVFLGKSSSEPWGNIYIWLYNNFPGFSFYREPSKFWSMIAFTYAVLISFSILYIPPVLYQKAKKIAYARIATYLFYTVIISTSLWVGKPAFTQELGPLFNNLIVSKEHFIVKDFIAKQKAYFRTYYVPGIYRMGFGSEIHPMLGLYDSSSYFQTFDPKLLSLLSVKYVIFPPDITNDVYRGWGRREDYEKNVASVQGLTKIENTAFGKFSVYENKTPYMPHIYTVSDLNYIIGEKAALPKILSLTAKQTASYYLEDPTFIGGSDEDNKKFYDISNEIYTTAMCIRCENKDYKSGFYFPFARFLPDSPFYNYINDKEDQTLFTYQGDTHQHLNYILFYGLKRLIEVQRIGEENLHQEYAKVSILEQRKLIQMANVDIERILKGKNIDNTFLLAVYDNLTVQSAIINNIFEAGKISPDNKGLLQDNQDLLFRQIKNISTKLWVSEGYTKRYFVTVPQDGEYTFFIENLSTDSAKMRLDGLEDIDLTLSNTKWMSGGTQYLTTGVHKVAVEAPPKNLVPTTSIHVNNTDGKQLKEIVIPIDGLEGSTEYKVTFNYRISSYTKVHFTVNREFDFVQAGYIRKGLDQYLTDNNILQQVSSSFSTRVNEKKAYLKFLIQADPNKEYDVNITDIFVKKTTGPMLVLKKTNLKKTEKIAQPTITFQWINPMKYKVHVENAKKPFYLVFSETFDPSWQAHYTNDQKSTLPVVATYSNGKIYEQEGANDLDLFSFLSLFKKQEIIPVHTSINGYANAWYVEKPGTYTITIEFIPQRMLTLSLVVSAFALVVAICIYIFISFYNEKKKQ